MEKAELVLFSDAIFDSVKDEPFPGGAAISGEKILFVGSKEAASRHIGPYTLVKDFGDKLIFPGICDAHAHLEGSVKKDCAIVAKDMNLCKSEEECVQYIREFATKHPELERIHGSNWAIGHWGLDAKFPTKVSLDKYFPDTPVYLFGASGHENWINSKAIEEINLEKLMADNPHFLADHAPRDKKGEFTGFLKEGIAFLVHLEAFTYSPETRAQWHAEFTKIMNSYGITAMSEVTMPTPANIIDQYWSLKAMENRNELTARYYLSVVPRGTPPYTTENIKELDQLNEFFNSDKLRIAGIKAVLDGVPSSHTAAMLEPYPDDPMTKGEFRYPPEVPMAWYKEANRLGYSVRVHCCGDAAVRLALDCFEESNKHNDNSNIRNSVEHMGGISDQDVTRFGDLGVIASMQPIHQIMGTSSESPFSGTSSKNDYCYRKLINSGAMIVVGTDSPVVDINPFHNIYAAVTRKHLNGTLYKKSVDQVLTLAEMLKAYTVNAAFINHMEHKVGTLEAGKYADIAVADQNLFAIPPDSLKDCRAVCTVFNGRIVYEE